MWVAGGTGYRHGGESTIEGDRKNDETKNVVFGASLGVPITRYLGLKVGYRGTRTQNGTGRDSDDLVTVVSVVW